MNPIALSDLLNIYQNHRRLCTDTRKIQPGDLYWALKGERFDGNQFAEKALDAGATLAVVDDSAVIPPGDQRYILVEDGLKTLQNLAHAVRSTWTFPVIGLTGSNGKTTTKELLASVLRTKFRVHATAGNYNNHIGVPLTILACPDDTEIAIVEMGTNQPGDILELAEIAEPDFGLITNVGYAHIEKLLSLDGVMVEKGQLFEVVKKRGGTLFVNADDPRVVKAAGEYERIHSFGRETGDMQVTVLNQNSEGMTVQLQHASLEQPIQAGSSMSGDHNALNMAAAALIGLQFGLSPENIADGIAAYVPANHRSQLIDRGDYRIWMDAYNANPSSMAATVRHVMALGAVQVALVIGDMKELGDQSIELHRQLGTLIQELQPSLVIGVGDHIRYTLEEVETPTAYFPNTAEAKPNITALLAGCDLVLLKASRSIGLEALLEVI